MRSGKESPSKYSVEELLIVLLKTASSEVTLEAEARLQWVEE